MSIASTSAVQTATTSAQGANADVVNVLVLKKALDAQANNAAQLIQSLPQPQLATSGSLGTQVNSFA
jgi:hypothetical protein